MEVGSQGMSKNKIWLASNQKVALIAQWHQNERDEEHRKGRWSEKRTNKSLQVLRSFCFVVCFLFRSEAPRLPKEEEEENTWSIILVYIPPLFVLRLPKNSPTWPSSLLHRSAHKNTATLRSIHLSVLHCKNCKNQKLVRRSSCRMSYVPLTEGRRRRSVSTAYTY